MQHNKIRTIIKENGRPIRYIVKNGCHECIYPQSLSPGGYPLTSVNGKNMLVHRYIYDRFIEKLPNDTRRGGGGTIIMHTCDNRKCINPAHLKKGTMAENSRDMVDKSRNRRGERVPSSKLTEDQVREIKSDLRKGYSPRYIALDYNISPATIYMIKKGLNWAWVA